MGRRRRSKHRQDEKIGSEIPNNTETLEEQHIDFGSDYRNHTLEWIVAAPVAGRLVKIYAQGGMTVKKGQPMFAMISEDRELEVVARTDGEVVSLVADEGITLREGQPLFFLLDTANVIPDSFNISDLRCILDESRDLALKDVLVDFNAAPGAEYKTLDQDVHKSYKSFKKFDIVFDHSDHLCSGMNQPLPTNDWSENIKKEWISLQEGLPDTIFVRAYESRMDLLRAVIIGLEGTPYHNGLFFFDACLPEGYPHEPPLVRYHCGGLLINPNMWKSVRLKLPTTDGKEEDMWVPGTSTMLQLLVSIQNQILCENPLSCDVLAAKGTSLYSQVSALLYKEETYVKSLKTMEYIINNPPKNFEDFVIGHFRNHATDILKACKEEASKESCTPNLKRYLDLCFDSLVVAFSKIGAIGAKEARDLLPLGEKKSLFA